MKYLPQMANEDRRLYLFVAIDRAIRWFFVRIFPTCYGKEFPTGCLASAAAWPPAPRV